MAFRDPATIGPADIEALVAEIDAIDTKATEAAADAATAHIAATVAHAAADQAAADAAVADARAVAADEAAATAHTEATTADAKAVAAQADADAADAKAVAADAAAADAHTAATTADGKAVAAQTAAATADAKAVTADGKAVAAQTAANAADAKAVAAQTSATQANNAAGLASAAAAAADTKAVNAGTVAARKVNCFTGTSTPTAEGAGDLWLRGPLTGGYYELRRASAAGTGSWVTFGLVAAAVAAGAIDGLTITGPLIRTDVTPNARLEIGGGFRDRIQGFNGQDETTHSPGRVQFYKDVFNNPASDWGSGHKIGAGASEESWISLVGQADNLLDPPRIDYHAGATVNGEHRFNGKMWFGDSARALKGVDWDETSYNFTAGSATIPHNLLSTPKIVIVQCNTLFLARASAYTATNFTCDIRQRSDGANPPNGARSIAWLAIT